MKSFVKSKTLYERASNVIPGGVSSNNRASWKPFPLFYSHALGSKVWDVDGNQYIDYVLGRGPLILGHSPECVITAINKQLSKGLFFAGQTELEVKLAEKIKSLVPCAEMTRFCNSGSESVHAALRLARSFTGKKKILKFEGHYHGWYDNIAWSFSPALNIAGLDDSPNLVPMSLGQNIEDGNNLFVLPWNRLDLVERLFRENHDQIAAVITEPIMFNGFNGGILPEKGYLQGLRELCSQYSILLIFDEIITGFRVSLGGAQQHFNVIPDLATFAKALGSGVVLSALAGKKDIMKQFSNLETVHTGTYNAYPPTLAGAIAGLNELSANNGLLMQKIHSLGKQLMDGIIEISKESSLPLNLRGLPPAFVISFDKDVGSINNYREALQADKKLLSVFWGELQDLGIRISPEGLLYLSAAHSEDDIEFTLNMFRKAIKKVESSTLLESMS